jgi:hypothetical protein
MEQSIEIRRQIPRKDKAMTAEEQFFIDGLKARGEVFEIDETSLPELGLTLKVPLAFTHLLIKKKDGTEELKRVRFKS